MNNLRLTVALLAMGASSFAIAQGMGMGMGMGGGPLPAFEEVDTNDDDMVSREELGAVIPARGVERVFSTFDADKDDQLNATEYAARAQGQGMGMGQAPTTPAGESSDASESDETG